MDGAAGWGQEIKTSILSTISIRHPSASFSRLGAQLMGIKPLPFGLTLAEH